jgi:hypothetical protein
MDRERGRQMKQLLMKLGVIFAAAALVSVILAGVAGAADTQCVGAISGPHDNVVVPRGATCVISNAQIKGSIKVYGNLDMFAPRSTVGGNIDGEPGHGYVRLWSGSALVQGNVQIKGSTSGIAAGFEPNQEIRGNFQWEENNNRLVAQASIIGGNVKAEKNTGGGFIGPGNNIGNNVECKENTPPIGEGGNIIGGDDKCPE